MHDDIAKRTDTRVTKQPDSGLENVTSDFHIHFSVSYDAPETCTVESLVAVASGLGLKEIGLADHVHVMSEGQPGFDQRNTGQDGHNKLA